MRKYITDMLGIKYRQKTSVCPSIRPSGRCPLSHGVQLLHTLLTGNTFFTIQRLIFLVPLHMHAV